MSTGEKFTIYSLLREGALRLSACSPSASLDAEVLLGHLLSFSRLQLIMNAQDAVSAEAVGAYFRLLERRAQNEPVAYLTGEKEFYGLTFQVSPDVLVPRPETEILVDAVLRHVRSKSVPARILDLGTGSGAIPVALAVTLQQEGRTASIVAIDKSVRALEFARKNAERHGVRNSIEFIESDWFSAVSEDSSFDIIVSNPPYITEGDHDVSPELSFEPQSALYAGEEGLADIAHIFSAIATRRHMPELILIEIGACQGQVLIDKLKSGEFGAAYGSTRAEILRDLAGLPRVLAVRDILSAI